LPRTPPSLITLTLLTALSALTLNMILPSLPSMARNLAARESVTALAVSGYMLASALFQLGLGGFTLVVAVGGLEGVERVVLVVLGAGEGRQQCGPHIADLLAAIVIPDRVLQNALEQHGKLGERLVTVFLGEPHHRVLHDVECRLFVADREQGLLEGPFFDAGEEVR